MFVHPDKFVRERGPSADMEHASVGLRVSTLRSRLRPFSHFALPPFFLRADGVYREERFSRWNLPEYRAHSLKGHVKQFAHLPPDEARPEEERYPGYV